ncbi:hypothetical protein ZWY2020_058366 [Hordeum vulgare]|nr:hypothetical protein ZWY2020_058366 [Hordeum vulgare]
MLKNRLGRGDPMAHLVKVVPQNAPPHRWLKRGMDPPPNRYDIKPGRPWDGVEHSNGYEKDMYKLKNDNQATEQEAYVWSVADMWIYTLKHFGLAQKRVLWRTLPPTQVPKSPRNQWCHNGASQQPNANT